MSERTIYIKDDLEIRYDDVTDFIIVANHNDDVCMSYFTLEEIMENARKAHVMRNNLRMGEEE